ncbi:peptidase domain-containing ABC transporter [Anaerosporobacter sp.]|uniref:peptidase domain-containing ABC transporter n=1 Tax=Anaerosporobacter sp. TaxID=1872529 RepID=UPI00286F9475|nr:peptidase domain-containing ABC transporter [Anaerosporobacter sp.]
MKHLRKVPYIEQMQQTECGLCCIAMLLRYYGSHETLSDIRGVLEAGRDGLRISHLQNYLVQRDFETKIYRINIEQMEQIPLPAVVFWENKHFVILEHIKKDIMTVIDPAYGRISFTVEQFQEKYSGIMMTAVPTEEFKPEKRKVNPWMYVLKGLKQKKGIFLKTLLVSIVAYGIQMGAPLLIQVILDGIIKNPTSVDLRACVMFSIGFIIMFGITNFSQRFCFIGLGLEMDKTITKNTFHKLMHLPYSYFENRSNGDLLFRLSSLEIVRMLLSEHIISGIIQFGYAIAILIYMLQKSFFLAGITMVVFLFNGIFILVMREKIMEANQLQIVENTKLQSIQTEAVYSMFGIKTSGIEEDIWNSWNEKYVRSQKAYKRKGRILNGYTTVISLLRMLGPFLVLLFAIQMSLAHKITLGECIAFYSLSASLLGTSMSLFNLWNDYTMAGTYLERLLDITQEKPEEQPEHAIPIAVNGEIEFRNVSFSYTKNAEPVISNVSFKIKKGSKFAVVGASGSGKSTITKLMLGLYQPTKGDIFYEGINLKALDKRELRKQIGVVPQDMSLFNRSIAENISLMQENQEEDGMIEAAKIAQVHDEIMNMPMNYRTILSDRGQNLSGGQRQRIVLARAIMSRPNVMVLDEATSSLDNINEKKISDYLREAGNTQIVIAHRMSTIVDADEIMVLQKGESVESGTHEELIRKNGVYAALYRSRETITA